MHFTQNQSDYFANGPLTTEPHSSSSRYNRKRKQNHEYIFTSIYISIYEYVIKTGAEDLRDSYLRES